MLDFGSREWRYGEGDILLNLVWFIRVSPELTEGIVLIFRRLRNTRFLFKGITTIKSEVRGF